MKYVPFILKTFCGGGIKSDRSDGINWLFVANPRTVVIIDKPLLTNRIELFYLFTPQIRCLSMLSAVSSDCSDRIIANKDNVISPCMPSAPL